MTNYWLEFFTFAILMFALGIKNLLQLTIWKDNSVKNFFQMIFFFAALLLYAFLNGLVIDKQPFLFGLTGALLLMLIVEAISLGEKKKEYELKAETIQGSSGEEVYYYPEEEDIHETPKELKLAWTTFFVNLFAFLVAVLQVFGMLEKIITRAIG